MRRLAALACALFAAAGAAAMAWQGPGAASIHRVVFSACAAWMLWPRRKKSGAEGRLGNELAEADFTPRSQA